MREDIIIQTGLYNTTTYIYVLNIGESKISTVNLNLAYVFFVHFLNVYAGVREGSASWGKARGSIGDL